MKKALFALLALVLAACSAAPAPGAPVPDEDVSVQSQAAQTIPNWCYEYPVIDGLDSWGNWGLWNPSDTGAFRFGSAGTSKSPPSVFLLSFSRSEHDGGFMALDRYISMPSETTHTFSKCGGSAPTQSVNSTAKFCAANVYARTSQGARAVLQILDPVSYVIMAQADVQVSTGSAWTLIATPLAYNCRTDVVVRLALVKQSNPTSLSVAFDDFTVLWYY